MHCLLCPHTFLTHICKHTHHYQQKSSAPPLAQVCLCVTQNQQKQQFRLYVRACVWAHSHVHTHSSYRPNSCTHTQRINFPQLCLSVQTSFELAGQLAVRNDLRPSEKKDFGQSWGESLWLAPLLEVFWASLAPKKDRLMNPSKLGPNFVWTTN